MNDAKFHWNRSAPADPEHPFLLERRIGPHGARARGHHLVLPVFTNAGIAGEVSALLMIPPSGKIRISGPLSPGSATMIDRGGEAEDATALVVCIDWASGCVIADSTAASVVVLCAHRLDNLEPVVQSARTRFPGVDIMIAGERTPSCERACSIIAMKCSAVAVVPELPDGAPSTIRSFSDLHVWVAQQ